jgi:hypothetical protein
MALLNTKLSHQSILRDFLIPPFGLLLLWLRRGKDAVA